MASKYGFTVDKILYEMTLQDINKLDTAQMRDAVKVLNDAANKRARRLEEKGQTASYAYQSAIKGSESELLRFTTPKTQDKGQARNTLYKQLTKTQDFLRAETSTLSKRSRTVVDSSTGEIKRVVTNAGWSNVKGKVKKAMFGKDYQREEAEQLFNTLVKDANFWQFVSNLKNNYGYDSNSAINIATVYSSNYDSYEKIQRAKSYLTGAEVDPQEVLNTSIAELWEDIFNMSGASKENFAAKEGYVGKEEREAYKDANFTNIWRSN